MLQIRPINRKDLPFIVKERSMVMETLRTPFMLNNDQQIEYYERVLCDRNSDTRYWIFQENNKAVGYGGIENIQWENSIAEISLLIFNQYQKKGYGKRAVDTILDQAFNYIGLENVFGECYYCGNVGFWDKIIEKKNGYKTILPNRKYYNGQYYSSLYFNINKEWFI